MNTENYEYGRDVVAAIGDAVNYLIEETELTVSFRGRPVAIDRRRSSSSRSRMTEPI